MKKEFIGIVLLAIFSVALFFSLKANTFVDLSGHFAYLPKGCTDSDNSPKVSDPLPGLDAFVRGKVEGLSHNNEQILTVYDGCADSETGLPQDEGQYLIEENCLPDNRVNSVYHRCPSGYSCIFGACR